MSCSGDDNPSERNPFLPDTSFSFQIDLNLPQFNDLRFQGGSTYVSSGGVRGFFVFNLTGTSYMAWEASCPNHSPNSCSTMSINGVLTQCSCENYEYSLATGQALLDDPDDEPLFPMLNYRVNNNGGILLVSN